MRRALSLGLLLGLLVLAAATAGSQYSMEASPRPAAAERVQGADRLGADARLPLQTPNAIAAALPGVCGDLNGDSQVNVFDAIITLQIIVGLVTPTPTQLVLADLNRDRAINVFDAITLLQIIVGLVTIDTCGPQFSVKITSPADQSLFETSLITVSGTVSESAVAVEVNQISATFDTATFTVDVPLDEGTNTITAVARDAAGNVATDSIQVALGTIVASAVDPSVTTHPGIVH